MTTSDKQFDSQFDKVENLVHYPWIGCNYASAPKRVLIMGDSHYTVNDEGEFCPEEYDRCVTDKEYTRGIINCAIEKGGWKFHTNLQKTFLDESDMDIEGFWNKIASYNFIQEPMKGTHEVPSLADYETAWKCLADVVQIIKPDICIFVGLRNDNGMNALEGKDVKNILVLQNWLERIRKEVTNKVLSIKRISDFLIFPILAQPTLKKI